MLPEPPDTDIKERGQTAGLSLIRTHLFPPSWCPPLITLGSWPMFSHSVLTSTPSGRYCSQLHLTEEKQAQKGSSSSCLQRGGCGTG